MGLPAAERRTEQDGPVWPDWFPGDPPRAALLCDFDGTLAPIVDDPATSEPLPGVVDILVELSGRLGVVGVVSGRPADFLVSRLRVQDRRRPAPGETPSRGSGASASNRLSGTERSSPSDLPPGTETSDRVKLVGLYGLERALPDGRTERPAEAERWLPVFAGLAKAAEHDAPRGAVVERKGLTLALHWRTADDPSGARSWAEAFVRRAVAEHRLDSHGGRMSIELRPLYRADKGTVVEDLARESATACFVGDDVGDLPAFDALDRLEAAGTRVVRVAVDSTEAPAALLRRADLVVGGPEGVLPLLRQLL